MTGINPDALSAAKERLRKARRQAADAVRFFTQWEIDLELEAKGTLELAFGHDRRLLSRRGTRGMSALISQKDNADNMSNTVAVIIAKEVLDMLKPGAVDECLKRKAETERARRRKDTEVIIYHAMADHIREFGMESALDALNFALESMESAWWMPAEMRAVVMPKNVVSLDQRRARNGGAA